MKNLFIQFRQWILKNKKRLIYWAFVLFIGQICFFNIWWIQNEVFAQSNSNRESATQRASFEKTVNEKTSLYDFYKKTVYILVYPMMFLAGKLVDNSLVYWEIFKFDIVLWNLWNVIKNFANYGLWFLFIFYIFRYLIKQDKDKNPKWIIMRSLIAGVWIQASWFLMSVLIDISTIMTYGIWGLPLSVLWWVESTAEKTDPYVMKNIISVDANNIANTQFYLTNILSWGEQIYISECETFSIKDSSGNKGSDEYILGPKMHYYQDQNWKFNKTEKELCDYYGSVYKFNSLIGELLEKNQEFDVWTSWGKCANITECQNIQSAYTANKNKVISNITSNADHMSTWTSNWQILIPWEKIEDNGFWWDEDNKWVGENKKTQKMSELMKSNETKTYVGVFTSLYASLLEAWRWMIPDTNGSPYVKFLSCVLTLGHALAIAIPLAVALFVLLMRVAIIWMAIVLSPMIVLLSAFWFLGEKGNGNGMWKYLSYFSPGSLISIIFSPVVICFAISMSTVLVRVIEKMNFEEIKDNFEVLWIIRMDLGWFSVWLSRLIVWVMGVAISWFLVWMAVESSKLWKTGIVSSIKGLVSSSLWAIPIVPIVRKDWTQQLASVNSVKTVVSDKFGEVKREFNNGETTALNELFNREKAETDAMKARESVKENNRIQNFVNWLKGTETINANWMNEIDIDVDWNKEKFSNFSSAQKEKIIEEINKVGGDLLNKIWKATPNINIDDKVKYEFKDWKFKKQETQN